MQILGFEISGQQIAGAVVLLIGLVLLYFAVQQGARASARVALLQPYEARVLRVSTDYDSENERNYERPYVELTLPNGEPLRSTPEGDGAEGEYTVGETITVYMDPEHPYGSLTLSKSTPYTVAIFLGLAGLTLGAWGVANLLLG